MLDILFMHTNKAENTYGYWGHIVELIESDTVQYSEEMLSGHLDIFIKRWITILEELIPDINNNHYSICKTNIPNEYSDLSIDNLVLLDEKYWYDPIIPESE